MRKNRKKLREFVEKEHVLWHSGRGGVCRVKIMLGVERKRLLPVKWM